MKRVLSIFLISVMLFSLNVPVVASGVETCTVAFSELLAGEDEVESQEDTSASDGESTSDEEDTSASDGESTSDEEDTSASDEESTSGEEDTSASDEESSSGEEDTSASYEESTSGEEDTTTEPTTTEPTTTEPTTTEPTTTEPVIPDIKADIKVKNSAGVVVKTYKIVTNKLETDAEKQIDKALNYCKKNATASDIYTVVIPKSEYGLHSSLNVYSNTVLDLGGSTFYRFGDCGAMIRFGKGAETVYGYTGYVNITVKNGTLDGNDVGAYSLMRFGHASNVTLTNLTMQNTKGVAHLLTFAACDNVKITNCKFTDMEMTSQIVNNNCEAVQIDVLKKEYFPYPAYDGTKAKNILISDCYFANVQRGVGTHTAIVGHYLDNIDIINNTFENVTGYAVRTLNYTNSEISGNIIKNCGSGINCGTTTNFELVNFYAPLSSSDKVINNLNIKIYNNTMTLTSLGQTSTAYGIKVAGALINNHKDADGRTYSGDCRISGIYVENNKITSTVSKMPFYGIYLDGAKGSVYGESSDLVIKNNTVTNSYQGYSNVVYAVRIDNSVNILVSGNKLTDTKSGTKNMQMGIAAASSDGLYITGNNISNVRYCAVKLNIVNKARVQKNTISHTDNSSVYVCGSSKNIFIVSNKISDSAESAVYVSGAKVNRVESNTILNCEGHGIYFSTASTGVGVVSNYICNSGKTGIYADSTAFVNTITKNTVDVDSDKIDGIAILGKANAKKITYNKINTKKKKSSKSLLVKAKYGIRIKSSACKIKQIANNTVRSCTGSGIYVISTASKPKIQGNNIRNSKYGITYKKKTAKVGENKIKKCTKADIKVIKAKKTTAKKNKKA